MQYVRYASTYFARRQGSSLLQFINVYCHVTWCRNFLTLSFKDNYIGQAKVAFGYHRSHHACRLWVRWGWEADAGVVRRALAKLLIFAFTWLESRWLGFFTFGWPQIPCKIRLAASISISSYELGSVKVADADAWGILEQSPYGRVLESMKQNHFFFQRSDQRLNFYNSFEPAEILLLRRSFHVYMFRRTAYREPGNRINYSERFLKWSLKQR